MGKPIKGKTLISLLPVLIILILGAALLNSCGQGNPTGSVSPAAATSTSSQIPINKPSTLQLLLNTIPSNPVKVTMTSASDSVTITWDSYPNVTSYNLYFASAAAMTTTNKIENITSPYVFNISDSKQDYYFVLTAVPKDAANEKRISYKFATVLQNNKRVNVIFTLPLFGQQKINALAAGVPLEVPVGQGCDVWITYYVPPESPIYTSIAVTGPDGERMVGTCGGYYWPTGSYSCPVTSNMGYLARNNGYGGVSMVYGIYTIDGYNYGSMPFTGSIDVITYQVGTGNPSNTVSLGSFAIPQGSFQQPSFAHMGAVNFVDKPCGTAKKCRDYPDYKQTDYPTTYYDSTQITFDHLGCAVTAMAEISTAANWPVTPDILNSAMFGDIQGSYVDWSFLTYFTHGKATYEDKPTSNPVGTPFDWSKPISPNKIDTYVDDCKKAVIVGVAKKATAAGYIDINPHYVVVTGRQGSTYTINDPLGKATTLDYYGNVIYSYIVYTINN